VSLSRRQLLVAMGATSWAPAAWADDRRLAQRRTRHGTLEVVQRGGRRWLLEDGQVHSVYDPADPTALPFDYLQLLAVGITATAPTTGRVLVVGLGGGTLCRWLRATHPQLHRVAVEHSRPVLRLARRFFDLDDELEVHVDDGRRFVEGHGPFDLVVLDASSEDYVPPHLATVDFFRAIQAPLVLMNSWRGAPRAADEWATWSAAFPRVAALHHAAPSQDNRVLLGGPGLPIDLSHRVGAAAHALEVPAVIAHPEVAGSVRHDPRR